jgi:hypothetical protein
VLVIAAVVAWVAFLHVPPFFIFPLMWFAFAGRRFGGRGGRGGGWGGRGGFSGPRGPGRSFVGNR